MSMKKYRIIYKQLPPILGMSGIKEATYKGVTADIAEGENWVSIYLIKSLNKRRGEVNDFIKLLKGDYPDKELWSSVPLNSIWDYIAHKHKIKHIDG